MNFDEARAEYERLRRAYDNRTMGLEEYMRRVQTLRVRDETGTYWAINGGTGDWLRWDGTAWVPGEPPAQLRHTGVWAIPLGLQPDQAQIHVVYRSDAP